VPNQSPQLIAANPQRNAFLTEQRLPNYQLLQGNQLLTRGPFIRQKLNSGVPLTTIQACDTNENISSHLQTIKKTTRRREMSVARQSFETEE